MFKGIGKTTLFPSLNKRKRILFCRLIPETSNRKPIKFAPPKYACFPKIEYPDSTLVHTLFYMSLSVHLFQWRQLPGICQKPADHGAPIAGNQLALEMFNASKMATASFLRSTITVCYKTSLFVRAMSFTS
jgi:hypothetical protein